MNDILMLSDDVYMFKNQDFYGEPVSTYLLNLQDQCILIDIPNYTKRNHDFIAGMGKNTCVYLSHGSTGTKEGNLLCKELKIPVYIHEGDKKNKWLQIADPVYWNGKERVPHPAVTGYHTPGHAAGSIALYYKEKRMLFTGDTVYGDIQNEIKDFMQESRNEDVNERFKSCIFLSKLSFDQLLPFHGTIILKNAELKLKNFLNAKLKTKH